MHNRLYRLIALFYFKQLISKVLLYHRFAFLLQHSNLGGLLVFEQLKAASSQAVGRREAVFVPAVIARLLDGAGLVSRVVHNYVVSWF